MEVAFDGLDFRVSAASLLFLREELFSLADGSRLPGSSSRELGVVKLMLKWRRRKLFFFLGRRFLNKLLGTIFLRARVS